MAPLSSDILEATRLTRAGRLAEATALLRRNWPGARRVPGGGDSRSRTADEAPSREPAAPGGPGAARALTGPAASPDEVRRASPRPVSAPAGARFEALTYSGAAGTRPYKLYVPSTYTPEREFPLVVMLHGCTQSPDDFAAGTRMNAIAEERGFLVAYPGQTKAANASLCWNWFDAAGQRRDGGEAALIAGITRAIGTAFAVDAARIFVAGLSAGGAEAAIMGSVYPDLFAAVGVHSGLACGAARDLPSAFSAMRTGGGGEVPRRDGGRPVRTIVFHGDGDRTVHPRNGEHVVAQASSGASDLASRVEHGRSPGGMAYTRTVTSRGGVAVNEHWVLHGAGHAWAGGSQEGSYTDPRGPDASREMIRFFLDPQPPSPT